LPPDFAPVPETKKAGAIRPFSFGTSETITLSPPPPWLFLLLRTIEQLDHRHRRVVSLPEPVFQDAQIAAVSLRVARPQLGEELCNDVAVAQAVEGEASVGERGLLASVIIGSTTRRSSFALEEWFE